MSDSEEDASVPDAATAKRLISEFELVTNTDEIMAQYQLQEHDWDLGRALNTFFTAKSKTKAEERASETSVAPSGSEIQSMTEGLEKGLLTTQAPETLVFVTWNIDGLDQHNRMKRTEAVAIILEQEKADVVFLQEVIPETFSYLESKLTGYEYIAAKQDNYFVATLLRKGRVYMDKHKVIDFSNSKMYRHVLEVQAHCGTVTFDLLNTHLESTKDHADERKSQLKQCLEQTSRRADDTRTVILAGDLNMRDTELSSLGGLPNDVVDVWSACGARKEAQYTWDMMRNTNLDVNFGKFRPRCRFDRIYLRAPSRSVTAKTFNLVGLQKITGTQLFPSDHWGLKAELKLRQEGARKRKTIEES